jgi:hypothetical protein
MKLMAPYEGLNSEHIKSHLQKYRIEWARSESEFLECYGTTLQNKFHNWFECLDENQNTMSCTSLPDNQDDRTAFSLHRTRQNVFRDDRAVQVDEVREDESLDLPFKEHIKANMQRLKVEHVKSAAEMNEIGWPLADEHYSKQNSSSAVTPV